MRRCLRCSVRPGARVFIVVLASALVAPWLPGRAQTTDTSGAAGSRPLSGRERDLLARAEKLNEEVLDLWRDDPEAALPKAEQVLEIRRDVLGTESSRYAESLDSVARISKLLGQYPRALNLYEEALGIRRRILGEEHLDYRKSLKNLAGLYYLMEDYEQAESFFAEASKIERKLAILDDIGEPAAFIAVRSFADVENALRDLARLGGGTAPPPDLLGLLKDAVGDLEGVDRTRPLGVTFPVLGDTRMLGIVCSIPYTDRERIATFVGRFFPVSNEQDGVLLLSGGPFPAYGRVDEGEKVFVLSTIPELLDSPRARLPGDLFAAENGPSVVLRINVAVATSLRNSPLAQLEGRLLDRVRRLAGDLGLEGSSYDEELFHRTVWESIRRLADQFLIDATTAQFGLRTKGEWTCDVEVDVRGSSQTAHFLAAQEPGRLRLPDLGSTERLVGLQGGIVVTEELRTAIDRLLVSARDWLASNPPPIADQSPASQIAHRKAALKLLSMIDQLFREKTIESGFEWITTDGEPQLVVWVRGARCVRDVLELAELVKVARSPGGDTEFTPASAKYGPAIIHRLRTRHGAAASGENAQTGESDTVFIAAEESFVVFCAGPSVEPLKRALDRSREQGPLPPPGPRRAWLTADLSFAALARSTLGGVSSAQQPVAAALLEGIREGENAPIVLTVEPEEERLVLHCPLPESTLRALAAALRVALASTREGEG